MAQRLNKEGFKYLLALFRWTLLMAVVFFLAAGRLDIIRAWLAFGVHLTGAIAGAVLMWRCAPGLANQRACVRQGTKTWDKAILAVYFLLMLCAIPITAGLDAGRYHWSHLGTPYAWVGIALYLAFFILFYWAMLTNEHFEGSSRIQNDRGHRVVMTGPYHFVRHPGYVAMILACFVDALIIGSRFALIPSVLAASVAVVRTVLEDKMLQDELEGYADYAGKTKYRLIPGVW